MQPLPYLLPARPSLPWSASAIASALDLPLLGTGIKLRVFVILIPQPGCRKFSMALLLHAPRRFLLLLPNTLNLQAWRDSAQNQRQDVIIRPQVYAQPHHLRALIVSHSGRLRLRLLFYPNQLPLRLTKLVLVMGLVFKVRTSSCYQPHTHQLFLKNNNSSSFTWRKSRNWRRKFCGSFPGCIWVRNFLICTQGNGRSSVDWHFMNSAYEAFRINKLARANRRSEESGNLPSPQDDTVTTRAEKVPTLSESPEIHESKWSFLTRWLCKSLFSPAHKISVYW